MLNFNAACSQTATFLKPRCLESPRMGLIRDGRGWVHPWIGLDRKITTFSALVGLRQALTSCTNCWREESDFYRHIVCDYCLNMSFFVLTCVLSFDVIKNNI